jgi:hypothetical protein
MSDILIELNRRAKFAYDTYAHRTGQHAPWEYLSDGEQIAWREVVETLDMEEEPRCSTCECTLICPVCEAEIDAMLAAGATAAAANAGTETAAGAAA